MIAATEAATLAAATIMRRCDLLADVSSLDSGIRRVYLSPEHARVNALAAGWMREVGMTTWQDAAGNQRGFLAGSTPDAPTLILASHLDTVPDAGRYDGIVGVLMAIEAVARLRDELPTFPFGLEVIAFSDEEGTRFGKALMGSSAVAGLWEPAWWELVDANGTTLRQAFHDFGLDPTAIETAAHTSDELAGYLEAHIEQGPYLELADQALGVVTSIASARRFQVEVVGEARHAGGTPYEFRKDALLGAAEAVLAVERICLAEQHIGTAGQFAVAPGAVNIIPGLARFSIDLRGEFDEGRDRVWELIEAALDEIMERRGLTWRVVEIHRAPAVFCAPRLMDAVRKGIRSTGEEEPLELFSKAGHDAMSLGAITDVGMLFLRNPGGISHHPDESVSREDVALGLDALVAAVRVVAGAPSPDPLPTRTTPPTAHDLRVLAAENSDSRTVGTGADAGGGGAADAEIGDPNAVDDEPMDATDDAAPDETATMTPAVHEGRVSGAETGDSRAVDGADDPIAD